MNHAILSARFGAISHRRVSAGFDRSERRDGEGEVVFDRNTNLPDGEKR